MGRIRAEREGDPEREEDREKRGEKSTGEEELERMKEEGKSVGRKEGRRGRRKEMKLVWRGYLAQGAQTGRAKGGGAAAPVITQIMVWPASSLGRI